MGSHKSAARPIQSICLYHGQMKLEPSILMALVPVRCGWEQHGGGEGRGMRTLAARDGPPSPTHSPHTLIKGMYADVAYMHET